MARTFRDGTLVLLEGQVASETLPASVHPISVTVKPLRGQIQSLSTYTNSRPETSNLYLIMLPDGRNKGGPKEGFDAPFINSDPS